MNEATDQQVKPCGTGRDITELVKNDVFTRRFLHPENLDFVETWARSIARYLKDLQLRQVNPEFKGTDVEWDFKVDQALRDDLEARAQMGEQKYGERLKAHNGRNFLVDAYQEAVDLWEYLRQGREQRENPQ